jgi:hypothetical protein
MDVTFTKKDGTERTMNCTLSPILVPSVKQDELVEDHKKGIKRHNPDVRTVWDLEKKGWRSFRYDSINKYETVCDIQEEIDRNQQEINDFKQEQRDLRKDRKIEKFVLNTEEKKK